MVLKEDKFEAMPKREGEVEQNEKSEKTLKQIQEALKQSEI